MKSPRPLVPMFVALSSLAWTPATALGTSRAIAPSATIQGQPAHSLQGANPMPLTIVPPLRGADPAVYAASKRRAAQVAAANAPVSVSNSTLDAGMDAAVFGSLNAVGLSATAQISAGGPDVTPPDTTGAIGLNHYVEIVNSQVAAYARASLAIVGSPVDLTTFVGGAVPQSVCDPQIKYDPQTERWFYAAIRCDGTTVANTLYLGFSKTSDPTNLTTGGGGGWCGYSYGFSTAFEDYPKLGLDSLHIILGTNSFPAAEAGFFTAHVFSLPKPTGIIASCPSAPALTTFGSKAEPLMTTAGHEASTPEPATVADGSPNGYVVAADEATPFSGSGKNIMIWQVTGSSSAPTLTPIGDPTVPSFALPPNVTQPGSTDRIDSSDSRLIQAVAAVDPNAGGAEAVWTAHTVAGGAGSVVRWYELIPSTVTSKQTGTISDPTNFVFNGAIAPTLSGGAVINYDTGSSFAQVQMAAQSRVSSAPPGTMNTPIALGSSSAVDTDFSCPSQPLGKERGTISCRWGDYAGASVDPTNGNVVWGSSQVNGPEGELGAAGHQAQWTTRSFALTANDLAPSSSFTISPNPATVGSSVGFNGAGSSDPDGTIVAYSWSFGDATVAGSGATPSHVYASPGTYSVTLTVTDNGGEVSASSQGITVTTPATSTAAASTVGAPTSSAAITSALLGVPNSGFAGLGTATVNTKTGAVTFQLSVSDPGRFSWLLTFQNGKFGAFASGGTKCKIGFVKLSGKCRPAKIVFAKGSKAATAAGTVIFTLKPSASALKALKNALKAHRGVPVTATLTFQSLLGGSPASRTRLLMVKLKKK